MSPSDVAVLSRPLAAALIGDTAHAFGRPSKPVANTKVKKPRQIYRQEALLETRERSPRPLQKWVDKQTNWTVIDWFAGMGGSSTGLVQAGFKLVHASNHWAKAVHTHHANHPDAGHSQVDITRVDPSMFPTADVGWFSPECKNHSNARGRKRPDGKEPEDVWGERLGELELVETEDGFEEVTEAAARRSRAMMEDVVRIVDYNHSVRGKPFKYFVVENVPEVTDWVHFDQWWKRLENSGYKLQIVSLNSAFAHGTNIVDEPATPQDRNRVYIVGTKKGMPEPNFEQRPPCYCTNCDAMVEGKQSWKETPKTKGLSPRRRSGRYGQIYGQYFFVCPESTCQQPVEPYARPISTVLDFSQRGETVGERISRGKALRSATMERLEAGVRQILLPGLLVAHRPVMGNRYGTAQAPAGFIMRNNTARGRQGQMNRPFGKPGPTLTSGCNQSVVTAPDSTFTTVDRNEPVDLRSNGDVQAGGMGPLRVPTAEELMRASIDDAVRVQAMMEAGRLDETDLDPSFLSQVRVRMMTAAEAAASQGFVWDYQFKGNQSEQATGIGNAVSPPAARWLGDRIMQSLEQTIVRGGYEHVLG